ncbi:MAG: hypothetical protein II951_05460 [Bacteroidales bacterium]|jgi:hypothetical protein|nr:hypothetical protein [Bacteroidales bacterium]
MKKILYIMLLGVMAACTVKTNESDNANTDSQKSGTEEVATTAGKTIVYNVYLKPEDMTDEYLPEFYADFDRDAFVEAMFEAVYHNRAEVTDMEGNPMTIEDIKTREIEDPNYSREKLAGIQFTEEWTFDPKTISMSKKVKKMLIGYEVVEDSMIVALRPGFMFHFK